MNLFSSRRRRISAAAIVLLLLFLLRPGASRLKSRIIASISSAVGRSVDIGSVHVRMLPRPGFDLENLVVYDGPAFGAEPMLRAGEVTAALRLTSLLRGRLEIARLELTEPSLNLVRREGGGWNLEALLERAAHMPLAPTAKTRSEARPGFPYIQATGARINFKNGPEKKPYALTNADFSLWQDSENVWGVRLKAQPVRTDLNSNDTGMLQINGTWQRAATFRDTPLEFSVEWNRAQLGQLTKLFTGSDQGWRGGVQLDVTLKGTPSKLQIASDASIQDFRRYDITSGEALRVAAHCDAQYSSPDHQLHQLLCSAPVGAGLITLKGEMGLPGQRSYALSVNAENIPTSAAVALAQRAKKNLPDDLSAGGIISGQASIRQSGAASQLEVEGQGEIADFSLISAANKAEIGPASVPFAFGSESLRNTLRNSADRISGKARVGSEFQSGPHFSFGPFALTAGRGATARGWVNRGGYSISIAGETEISRILRAARMAGLPALQTTAEGTALLDLQIAGDWTAGNSTKFSGAEITGTAKLRNVHFPVRGASGAVEIASADMQLSSNKVQVTKLNAKAADAVWTGSLEMPRGCGTPGACEVHFDLSASQVTVGDVIAWARPRPKERAWYQLLGSSSHPAPAFLGNLRASGRVTTQIFRVHNLALAHASANLRLDSGKLQISELTGDFSGGKHRGTWTADFSTVPAVCSGSGGLTGVFVARANDLMKDTFTAGTASASYRLNGPCGAEFWQSAEGTVGFDLENGAFARVALAEDEGPLKFARLSGQSQLHESELELKDVKLESAEGKFELSGTVSLQRELDLKLAKLAGGTAASYTVTGTLAEPKVAAVAGTEQAKLKQNNP